MDDLWCIKKEETVWADTPLIYNIVSNGWCNYVKSHYDVNAVFLDKKILRLYKLLFVEIKSLELETVFVILGFEENVFWLIMNCLSWQNQYVDKSKS